MTRGRLGAWCALGCLQFFVFEQLARLGWPGRYSLRTDYISDLGAGSLCAAHGLMNASFGAQAVLIAAAALLLPRSVVPGIARGILLLSAIGLAMVATHPVDRDANTHIGGARIHFVCAAAGMLAAGLALLPRRGEAGIRRRIRAALLFGGAAAAGDLLLGLANLPLQHTLGQGLLERLAAYPLPLWLAFSGGDWLLRPPPALGPPL